MPPFECEVFKAPDCFLLRHRSNDHRERKIECEVLRAAFRKEINRSVDKGRRSGHGSSLAPSLEGGQQRGRPAPINFLRISSPYVPRFQQTRLRPRTMLIGGTGQKRTEADHRALLGETGFSLTRLSPTAGPLSIIESRSSLPRRAERDEVRESSNGSGPYLRSLRETLNSRSAYGNSSGPLLYAIVAAKVADGCVARTGAFPASIRRHKFRRPI